MTNDVDPFRCPECGAARRGASGVAYHAPTCPRALGRSTGRGPDAATLRTLGALLAPGSCLYAMIRSVSRSGTSYTVGFAIVRDGAAERVTRAIGLGLGLEYHKGEDGLILRVDAVPVLVERLSRALGLEGRPLTWQWL